MIMEIFSDTQYLYIFFVKYHVHDFLLLFQHMES